MTHKVTAGAKSFGSFFSGVVNKAGAKIKETVKDNVSFHSFHREAIIIDDLYVFSQSLVTSTKSRKHLSRISLARAAMLAPVHGLAIKMKIKLRKKFSVYQA